MKLSPSVLKTIALSAGIAAGISTTSAENKTEPNNQKRGGAAADAQLSAKPAANEPNAKAIFLRHDADKDGKLSMEEFDKAFAEIRREFKVVPGAEPPRVVPAEPCPACGMG